MPPKKEYEVEQRIVNWAIIIPGVIAILTAAWFAFAFGVRVAMWPVEQQVHEVQRTLDGQGKDIVEIKQTLKIHVDTDISKPPTDRRFGQRQTPISKIDYDE